ncbi:MAG: hypothetical protein EBR82_57705 [Caulobacteraceae bacterium]|nr:hypothetical protein [Caulobacteraceae bacterium]
MKQIWPNYSYSPATNVLTLTGLNIDRDQLLLVAAPQPGRIMYNFADSTVTASAFTQGANTALTLVASTAGLTTTAALVIYYDDQLTNNSVSISNFPASQTIAGTVTANTGINLGDALPQNLVTGIVPVVILNDEGRSVNDTNTPALRVNGSQFTQPISGTVTIGSCVTHGVTIANTSVTVNGTFYQATQPVSLASLPALAAGTAQIGSVTASISGTVPVSGTFYQATQPVSLASVPTHGVTLVSTTVTVSSLPALAAGTNQIGSVTASITGTIPVSISSVTVGNSVTIGSIPAISGTVTANTFAVQGTSVTTSNFTSTTASTVLANYNGSLLGARRCHLPNQPYCRVAQLETRIKLATQHLITTVGLDRRFCYRQQQEDLRIQSLILLAIG